MPRPQLKPGTHGHIAVAPTTDALRSRGAFVAHARVRPLDGGDVQVVRRFGATEGDALSALRAAIVERIGAVSGDPVVSVADRRILLARLGFAGFVNLYFDSTPRVEPGSDAERDADAAGSDHIPNRVVEGFVASAADHIRAWYRATSPTDDDPRPFIYIYADHTMWRAVLEAVASAIWVLGPDKREERIEHATRLAIYEWEKSKPVRRFSGEVDEAAARMHDEQRLVIEGVCERMGFDFIALAKKGAAPTKVVSAAREYLGREGDDFFYWWTICSRYTHAQTLTVMLRGVRTHVDSPDGGVMNVETDVTQLADVVDFAMKATDALVTMLVRRGFNRVPRDPDGNVAA